MQLLDLSGFPHVLLDQLNGRHVNGEVTHVEVLPGQVVSRCRTAFFRTSRCKPVLGADGRIRAENLSVEHPRVAQMDHYEIDFAMLDGHFVYRQRVRIFQQAAFRVRDARMEYNRHFILFR